MDVVTVSRAKALNWGPVPSLAWQSVGLDRTLLSTAFLHVTSGVGRTSEQKHVVCSAQC